MFKKFFSCAAVVALSCFTSTLLANEHQPTAKIEKTQPEKNQVKSNSDMNVDAVTSGGVDLQAKIKNDVPHLGVNWDLFLGYAFANWSQFTSNGHGAWALIGGISPREHTKGGFNIGADLGYQIIRYFGIELGYYFFRKVEGDNLNIQTPYFYGAVKVSYPFLANDDLSVFAKFGAALREIEYGGAATQNAYNNKRYSFRPIYGLGIQYYFSHRWKASMQWLEIPEYTSGSVNSKKSSKQVPRTDQVLIGLGYLFSI